jgi:hypothetical protein
MESANGAATELTGKILALQRTLPGAVVTSTSGKADEKSKNISPAPMVSNTQDKGLIGQMGEMIHLFQSLRTLHELKDDATHLQTSTQHLRAPLLVALRAALQQGQLELASPGPGNDASVQSDSGKTNSSSTAPPAQTAAGTPAEQATGTPAEKQRAVEPGADPGGAESDEPDPTTSFHSA